MLVETATLLTTAQSGRYAIGAFNVYNLEGASAVVLAAEAEHAPTMLQIHPKALEMGGFPLIALCLEAARNASVPMAVLLDHCTSAEDIRIALAAGISSVMADGSHLEFADNVSFTRN